MNDKLSRRQFIKVISGALGGVSILALGKLFGRPVARGAAQLQGSQFLPILPYGKTYTPTPTRKPANTATPTTKPTNTATPTKPSGPPPPHGLKNIIFMHQSIGERLIYYGNLRSSLTQLGYDFWDHNYNHIGLFMPDGTKAGYTYNVPNTTGPEDYKNIFQQPLSLTPVHPNPPVNTFSGLMRHEIVLFKSCSPASGISNDLMLVDYKKYYEDIRFIIDQYPNKIFIPFTPPPLPQCGTNIATAARARNFADWMKSPVYTAGHPNIFVFDFFDYLADPDPNSSYYNMLRASYQPVGCDSHPNQLANQTIAPILINFIDNAVRTFAQSSP